MPRAGDVVAGKYRVDSLVGEGGMGAVFAATHTLTGKRVALKWMLPELAADEGAVQRFLREAQAAGRIDHPNVVDIYDIGEHEGSTFMVMEYLVGETLTAALERGRLEVHRVVQLLIPAMRGVAAAHKMGVVHRDLKPDNIFLCRDPDGSYRDPKVLDFGISKVAAVEGQHNPRLTRTGAVMGTPYYMSPEQIRGLAEVDHRTDVYAFGVILYETLTGRVPFDADTYSALILEIATGTPRRPRQLRPDLPQGLEDVVMRAMERDPARRYSDVERMARALEPFAAGVTFFSERPDPTGTGPRNTFASTTPFGAEGPVRLPVRRLSLGVVAGLGAAALIAGGLWAFGPDDAPPARKASAARSAPPERAPAKVEKVEAPAPAPQPQLAPPVALLPDAGAPKTAEVAAPDGPPPGALPADLDPAAGRKKVAEPSDQSRSGGRKPGTGRTGSLRPDEF